MSITVMSWAWAHSRAEGADLLVLLAIADQAHDHGGGAWPSVRTLSGKARVSERTVQRCLKSLTLLGELEVRYGAGKKGANVYRVLMGDVKSPRQSGTPTNSQTDIVTDDEMTAVTPKVKRGDKTARLGVTPMTPEPSFNHQEPSPSAAPVLAVVIESPTAHDIIKAWCDWCASRPPGRVIGQVAKLVGEMLAEGIDPEHIKRGLAAWTTKGLAPSVLPSMVNEVMNARSSPRASQDVWSDAHRSDLERDAYNNDQQRSIQ